MAIYNPRQPSSRQRKGRRKPSLGKRITALFPRRRSKPAIQRPQAVLAGVQRSWRWKQIVSNLLVSSVLVLITIFVVWMGMKWLLGSDVFRLSDIRILGEDKVSERQILDLAGLQQGGNLIEFDTGAAKKRIAMLPWIEDVEIHTRWPSTVEIEVKEFEPFALVNVEEGRERHLYYMSRTGIIFAEADRGEALDYPVITGVQAGRDVQAGRFVQGSQAMLAQQLLKIVARGSTILPIQAISEVHLDEERGIILYLVDHPFPVYFGADRLYRKYNRLVRVLDQLYVKKLVDAVKEIRMDYIDDKVLVTGAQIDG